MHLHFERTMNTSSDSTITSLSWMGKVPDELPEDQGWKLNRVNYYQEGWLATGNALGIVGVTYSTSHCKRSTPLPSRTNYNLRGHRSEVTLVKWNEPYQKLATCDSSGVIFVWFKYDGRWSIELINDRNTPVTHFSWSHDGKMALICYQDGFVLVGSVAGQRYWSSMLNLESTITSGVWSPDDQLVYFGTTNGHIIVMDIHGAMIGQFQMSMDSGIVAMVWFCEKFKMEDIEDCSTNTADNDQKSSLLAVSLQNGFIYLVKTTDDIYPVKIDVSFCGTSFLMEWNNKKQVLAVAGINSITRKKCSKLPCDSQSVETEYHNMVKFYNTSGVLLLRSTVPNVQDPISSLTWGHNGKRLFIATGKEIHIAWISRKISSLQLLSRFAVYDLILDESHLYQLPIPIRIRYTISKLFVPTIKCCVPEQKQLREFVSRPPLPISNSTRLHCTMVRHTCVSDTHYTLYLEYLGGLFAVLKGKRVSKLKPEFVIFDPQSGRDNNKCLMNNECCQSFVLESEFDNCSRNNKNENIESYSSIDLLPESCRLVYVTSNIWGTKFKMHGLAESLPANLGHVNYKSSLLHLQPRQMTVIINELSDDQPIVSEPSLYSNVISEKDDLDQQVATKHELDHQTSTLTSSKYSIVPLLARLTSISSRNRCPNEESSRDLNLSLPSLIVNPVIRSYSVGFLDTVEMSRSNNIPRRRLVLVKDKQKKKGNNEVDLDIDDFLFTMCQTRRCNKSISLDISELKTKKLQYNLVNKFNIERNGTVKNDLVPIRNAPQISKSVPVTPQPPKKRLNVKKFASTSSSVIKNSFLNSPFLNRKRHQTRKTEIIEEDDNDNDNDNNNDYCCDYYDQTEEDNSQKLRADNFFNLETFQRTQILQKFKKCKNYRVHLKNTKNFSKKSNVFVMQNKAPIWNETSQVYQLDFGGRVTQESAKNFQIELQGKQVMQFGRIDENTYTLDFQYPFSALQAFSLALANITQRLK